MENAKHNGKEHKIYMIQQKDWSDYSIGLRKAHIRKLTKKVMVRLLRILNVIFVFKF